MARLRRFEKYVADFETTVYEGQEFTEVWAAALVKIGTEDVSIFHSIDDFYKALLETGKNLIVFFHNLKFDGSFLIDYFLSNLGLHQAFAMLNGREDKGYFYADKDMPENSFKYVISDKGLWYSITVMHDGKLIIFQDSYKLIPFSVKAIGKAFKTSRQKSVIEYEGARYAGCEITEEEQTYIRNDVLVVKEALEMMFSEGHDKQTIGACCMSEYKAGFGGKAFATFFPDLYQLWIDPKKHGCATVGDWIRRSYRGGWTYLKKGCERKIYKYGFSVDVNSLYPSQMHSDGGRWYPCGAPHFWTGNFIPPEAKEDGRYYFIRIKTAFELKKGYLPFIQIKGNLLYKGNQMLETSRPYSILDNAYLDDVWVDGKVENPYRPELTLTMTDYQLMLEHYDLIEPEILDGCWFYAYKGLFDEYITKYRKQKIEATTSGKRTISKLFLNNLYGKFATSTDSSFKKSFLREDKVVGFLSIPEDKKKPGYIPIGTAITSYARDFTIRAAQRNYKKFIYADTDSIHCIGDPEELIGVPLHASLFNHWKIESLWDLGYFVRPKMYVEHVTGEDGKPLPEEKCYYNLKAGGMTRACKDNLLMSITGDVYKDGVMLKGEEAAEYLETLPEEDRAFIAKRRTWKDFAYGLEIPGKLMAKRIRGGTVLIRTTYRITRN